MLRPVHYLFRLLWPPVPARKLGRRLPGYLAARFAAEPDWRGEFENGPPGLEKLGHGVNTVIRRWRTRTRGEVFVRAWPWHPRRAAAREHALAARLFEEAGLGVPRPLWIDDSFGTMRRWRLESAGEAAAEGEPLTGQNPNRDEWLLLAARELARLHRPPRRGWGKPWRPENEESDPVRHLRERIRKFRERISPDSAGVSPDLIRSGLALFERRLGKLKFERPALLHGDPHPRNLFAAPDGRLTWIDFGEVRHGLPERDLAEFRTLYGSGEAFAPFLEAYQSEAGPDRVPDPGAIRTFELLRLWERINSRVQRLRRLAVRLGEEDEDRLADFREDLEAAGRRLERFLNEEDSNE